MSAIEFNLIQLCPSYQLNWDWLWNLIKSESTSYSSSSFYSILNHSFHFPNQYILHYCLPLWFLIPLPLFTTLTPPVSMLRVLNLDERGDCSKLAINIKLRFLIWRDPLQIWVSLPALKYMEKFSVCYSLSPEGR